MSSTTPADVRSHLIEALQLDLIGPAPDDEIHAQEIIPQPPSKWYLTGFLVPYDAPIEVRSDDTGDDEIDAVSRSGAGDDEAIPDKPSARKGFFPSSMGMSLLVSAQTFSLHVTVCWGDYIPFITDKSEEESKNTLRVGTWQRTPRYAELTVPIQITETPQELDIPGSKGLKLIVSARPVTSEALVPSGTRSVSIFLVNQRRPASNKAPDAAHAFQTKLIFKPKIPLFPAPTCAAATVKTGMSESQTCNTATIVNLQSGTTFRRSPWSNPMVFAKKPGLPGYRPQMWKR